MGDIRPVCEMANRRDLRSTLQMPLKYGKIEFGIAEMVGGLPQKAARGARKTLNGIGICIRNGG
jgi:hypothetical protein